MIKNQIAELRQAKGLSQDQLAARLSVTRGRISQIENGKWWQAIHMIKDLTRALEASPDMLFAAGENAAAETEIRRILSRRDRSGGCIVLNEHDIASLERAIIQ